LLREAIGKVPHAGPCPAVPLHKGRGLQPVEGTYLAVDTCRMAKMIDYKRPAAGSVIPTQPVLAPKPLSGADWVHE
jgi:hypothetical protein